MLKRNTCLFLCVRIKLLSQHKLLTMRPAYVNYLRTYLPTYLLTYLLTSLLTYLTNYLH